MKKTQDIDYDKIDQLGDLYLATGEDWVLEVHHVLTEPCCPSACVYPEGQRTSRYRTDRDSIEESINASVELAYREMVLGEDIDTEFPLSQYKKPTFPWTHVVYEVPEGTMDKMIQELADYHATNVVELSETKVEASILEVFTDAPARHVEGSTILSKVGEGER